MLASPLVLENSLVHFSTTLYSSHDRQKNWKAEIKLSQKIKKIAKLKQFGVSACVSFTFFELLNKSVL